MMKKTHKKRFSVKGNNKLFITSLTVLVVFIAVGIGFTIWHAQPSFCNSVCHKPMDAYVDNYETGKGLARIHKEAGVTCLQCHDAKIDKQLTETEKWLMGDFKGRLDLIDYDEQKCLECHNETDIKAATSYLARNPHSDAHQVLKCTDCHRSHRDQVDYCASCHDNGGQKMITYQDK